MENYNESDTVNIYGRDMNIVAIISDNNVDGFIINNLSEDRIPIPVYSKNEINEINVIGHVKKNKGESSTLGKFIDLDGNKKEVVMWPTGKESSIKNNKSTLPTIDEEKTYFGRSSSRKNTRKNTRKTSTRRKRYRLRKYPNTRSIIRSNTRSRTIKKINKKKM